MNINDYDRTIVNFVKESLKLDNQVGDMKELKSHLQNLLTLNQLSNYQSADDTKLLQLALKLYDNQVKKNNNVNNVLLFFYKNNCKPSSDFVKEWKNIKTKTNGIHKMIAINCEKEKYSHICSTLNVFEYPTIKYVKNGQVHDYFGNLYSDDIIRHFGL